MTLIAETIKSEQTSSKNGDAVELFSNFENENFTFLKTVKLKQVLFWDVVSNTQKIESTKFRFKQVKLRDLIKQRKGFFTIDDETEYKRCKVQLYAKGVILRDIVKGSDIKTKKQQLCKEDDFLVAEIDAKVGGYGIVPSELENAVVSSHYFLYEIDKTQLLPEFLGLYVKTDEFSTQVKATGSTNYASIRPAQVLEYEVSLPPIDSEDSSVITQKKLVDDYNSKILQAKESEEKAEKLEKNIETYLLKELGIKIQQTEKKEGLQLARLKEISQWGVSKVLKLNSFISNKYKLLRLENNSNLFEDAFRGKSPKYDRKSNDKILNQKCVRWNEIVLDYAKSIESRWKNSINPKFYTKENDILINSTGEGTIGRSAIVKKPNENLLTDSHILLLRLNIKFVIPDFFVTIFNSSFGQIQINDIKSAQSTKQTELGIDNLLKLEFPFPPLKIQNKIVNHIDFEKVKIKQLKSEAENLRIAAKTNFEAELFE